jgi:hypothetical protein
MTKFYNKNNLENNILLREEIMIGLLHRDLARVSGSRI